VYSAPLIRSSPSKSVIIGFCFTAQGIMPTNNHSGSMSNNQQKHMEGERPASPQPHGRGRDGQARVEHICPGWWALEWTHTVQAPKNSRMAFDRLAVAMKNKKQTNSRFARTEQYKSH